VAQIVAEANKSLDYFEIERLADAVERVLLLGENARQPALIETLERDLELPVSPLTLDAADGGRRQTDATGRFDWAHHSLALAAALAVEHHE
jgi:Tfp pilus assembly PilM family ATPase